MPSVLPLLATSSAPRACPYLGVRSFEIQHRHLFFGRDQETRELEAIVATAPIALLHASSGAGKTSLLQAKLLPQLEERGMFSVMARPFYHPAEQLVEETVAQVLPPPAVEAEGLERALYALQVEDPGSLGLRELRQRVARAMHERPDLVEAIWRPLSAPYSEVFPFAADPARWRHLVPFTVRFLSSADRPLLLARRIEVLALMAGLNPTVALDLRTEVREHGPSPHLAEALATVPVKTLLTFFKRHDVQEAHRRMISQIAGDNPPLVTFFDRLCGLCRAVCEDFSLVIVLDQFEELFTRFTRRSTLDSATALDSSASDKLSMRDKYFAAVGEIVPRPGAAALPVHILISMRDDYVASLDRLEQETGRIPLLARYHLERLTSEAASIAIRNPAKAFGMVYDDAAIERLVGDLSQEDGKVEPSHLQIVCERVFAQADAAEGGGTREGTIERVVSVSLLERIGSVSNILGQHFQRVLADLSAGGSEEGRLLDRYEILNILEPLMTLGGKRNIVDREQLEQMPFHRPQLRRNFIEALARWRILRIETRLNGTFAEITHEVLIDSVRQQLNHALPENALLRQLNIAFLKLSRIEAAGFRTRRAEPLDSTDYDALWSYRGRLAIVPQNDAERDPADSAARLVAKPWLAEFLLRTAILIGKPFDHVRFWASLMAEAGTHASTADGLDRVRYLVPTRGRLDCHEIEDLIKLRVTLTPDEATLILDSVLAEGTPELAVRTARWITEQADAAA